LTYNAVAWPHRAFGVSRGYALGDRPAEILRSLHLSEWSHAVARASAFGYGALLAAAWISLDLDSGAWGINGRARAASLAPLLLGGLIGLVGLKRWPGRGVEVGLAALLVAVLLALAL
jgi:hypothetical protein